MKYLRITMIWAALMLVASAAFAQNEANRNRLSDIEKMEVKVKKGSSVKFDRFGIRLLPEIGYGAHLVRSEDFRSQGLDSGQAYLQALDVFYRPFSWGSVHLGAAAGLDWFKVRDLLFVQDDDHNIMVAPLDEIDRDKKSKYRSSVTEWTVMVPATLQFHFGKATLRLGAEALYSLPFSYDFLAAFSYGHFGVFGKFQPASARRFPDPGPTMSTWTVGVCLTTF